MLGFFSKRTTEKGLLVGVFVGFFAVWYVASKTDIAWPWFCAIGGGINIVVSLVASLIIDGRQKEYSPYTVVGQRKLFAEENRNEKEGGWFLVPGKIDNVSWWLIVFFVATIIFLYAFNALIT